MSWLSDTTANRYRQCYMKDFLDLSGNLIVRNGQVGIGTENPGAPLDVSGNMIVRNGNVGIGTENPGATLDVGGVYRGDGETNNIGAIVAAGPKSDTISHDFSSSTAILRVTGSNATNNLQVGIGSSGLSFNPWIQASYDNSTSSSNSYGTKDLLLNPVGGNVGIGTTSPGALLDVNGGMRAAYNSNTTSYFGLAAIGYTGHDSWAGFSHKDRATTGNYALMQNSGGTTLLNASSGQAIQFSIGNTTNMILNSSGAVGIGTATPRAKLHVEDNYDGGYDMSTRYGFKNQTSVGVYTNTIDANVGILAYNGDIITNYYILSANIYNPSDIRIKENIVDVDDASALETLRLLKPKRYNYKDRVVRGNDYVWGFIAQDLKETLPYSTTVRRQNIPNIYQQATLVDNKLIFENDINLEIDASGNAFNNVILYDASNNELKVDIVDFSNNIITIDDSIINSPSTKFHYARDSSDNVFVYGQEVNNFLMVQKSAIWTVATAALQEVDRQLQAEKAKIATLEIENATLKTQMADVLARLSALESS